MQHCVHRATYTAVSNWRPAISVNFSPSQYGAYAASSLLLFLHGDNKLQNETLLSHKHIS